MTRKTFLITYQNGKSKYVTRDERDELLLGNLITSVKGKEYKYIGQTKTFYALSDLRELRQQMIRSQRQEPDFYPGTFTFELREKRRREGMQSAEALAIALPQMVARLKDAVCLA